MHLLMSLMHIRFEIIGATFTLSTNPTSKINFSVSSLSLLRDAEGNHCSSFPATLLRLIQIANQMSSSSTHRPLSLRLEQQETFLCLLKTAHDFNPTTWAKALQARSPAPADLKSRIAIAAAHQAATCIYLNRILMSFDPSIQLFQNLEVYVIQTRLSLSSIPSSDPLFTASAWPTFIAGAETTDRLMQEWVKKRFQDLWSLEPWGLMRGAVVVLEEIWKERGDNRGKSEEMEPHTGASGDKIKKLRWSKLDGHRNDSGSNWVKELKEKDVAWLIL